MDYNRDALRLNIGFLIGASVGYSRDFDFDIPKVHIEPDLDLQDLTGLVRVTRTPQGLFMQAKLAAEAGGECARCLTQTSVALTVEFEELYAFSKKSATDSGLLVPENGQIDLGPLVREHMFLAMPITPLCRPDCRGLCPECGENLNEQPHMHEEEELDPRLEMLKKLKPADEE